MQVPSSSGMCGIVVRKIIASDVATPVVYIFIH